MDKKLLEELIEDTEIKDINDRYKDIVEITGIRTFVELSNYARGNELYFPKIENVIAPARNRRIRKEYNGYNDKELAQRYNITLRQIWNILRNEPPPGQMELEDCFPGITGTAGQE